MKEIIGRFLYAGPLNSAMRFSTQQLTCRRSELYSISLSSHFLPLSWSLAFGFEYTLCPLLRWDFSYSCKRHNRV